nr:hypothetical protein [Mycoplasmopsis bovis]
MEKPKFAYQGDDKVILPEFKTDRVQNPRFVNQRRRLWTNWCPNS